MKTINTKEIEKFSKLAEEWWNPKGKFKSERPQSLIQRQN